MITHDLDSITNITSRETVLNHYANETNSKQSSLFQAFPVIGRTNDSFENQIYNPDSGFNDGAINDDIYESIYGDTYLQTTELLESQTSGISLETTSSDQPVTQSVTQPVAQPITQSVTQPVTQPVIQPVTPAVTQLTTTPAVDQESTNDAVSRPGEENNEWSEGESENTEVDTAAESNSRVNSIISRWSGGSFTRRQSTRPQTGRRPLFYDSKRTRQVSQEINDRILQRSESNHTIDPANGNLNTSNTTNDHENQAGFHRTENPTSVSLDYNL